MGIPSGMAGLRSALLVALTAATLAGCGREDSTDDPPAPLPTTESSTPAPAEETADPEVVPEKGYTCGELRSAAYRDRQAEALLDERGIEGARRRRLKKRLTKALADACYPGPDYRRAADDVAAEVLGP